MLSKDEFYYVPDCKSILELIHEIKGYGDLEAFRSPLDSYTYQQLYHDILAMIGELNSSGREVIRICISDARLLAIAFIAVLATDNTALIAEERDIEQADIHVDLTLRDDDVLAALQQKNVHENAALSVDVNAPSLIVFSSGTTSASKGVVLSQKNIFSDIVAVARMYHFKKGNRYYSVLPYSHLFGLFGDILIPLMTGGCICYGDKLSFWSNIRMFKPDELHLPPVMIKEIAYSLKETGDLSAYTGGNLKKIICGGAGLQSGINEILEKYSIRAYSTYGLTECSPCISIERDDYYREGSAGIILPCCRVKFVDGEIVVAGDNVMLGYYNDEEATRKRIKDGWLYTGDLGYIDKDGFLFVTGRKDCVMTMEDGNKINPEFYENIIESLDSVESCIICESKTHKNKIDVKISVVKEDKTAESDICAQVHELLNRYQLIGYLSNIEICRTGIEKSKIGKKKRNITKC